MTSLISIAEISPDPMSLDIQLLHKDPPSPLMNEQRKGRWSPEEDALLTKLVKTYNYKNWKLISQQIQGRTAIQCLHRWTKILQPGLVKGPWTAQEDAKLIEWVKNQGPTKWTLCSSTIPGRSGKQCREHWNNSLNPKVKKGLWSDEEDFLIMYFYKKYSGSWKKISPLFNQRTENSIKNRFFSQLRKIACLHIKSSEKKFSSKIKLGTLLNYLDEATKEAKERFLKKKKIDNKELQEYLGKKELVLKNFLTSHQKNTTSFSLLEPTFSLENKTILPPAADSKIRIKFEKYDLDILEKEIYNRCDNIQYPLNIKDEEGFENNIDNVIDKVFNENIETVSSSNKGSDCLMCNMNKKERDSFCKQPTSLPPIQKVEKIDEYMTLMNKLIDLEQKVQETKKELKKFEN